MIYFLVFVLFSVAKCDNNEDVEFLNPGVTQESSKLENPNVLNVDDDEIQFNNVHLESAVNSDHETSIQISDDLQTYDTEVTFSVLNNVKFKNEVISISNVSYTKANATAENVTSEEKNQTVTKVECILRSLPEDEIAAVAVTNSTVLLKVLTPVITNATAGECAVILFFSSQCVFSARMAPHFNALARVFPGVIFYALDTLLHNNVHMRFGVVSVPNVLLFHNGKAVARYNDTYLNLENFVNFVVKYTGLEHNGTLNVTSADMVGPVPASLNRKVDYVLILAWVFTCFCIGLWFLKSTLCHKIVESVKNTWQEAEAQHEHTD